MSWIVLVIITVVFDSLRIFIDNYTSDVYFKGRHSIAQKYFYGFAFIVISTVMLIILHPDFSQTDPIYPIMLFLSGGLTSLAGIPYYRALELENTTNLAIFIQLAPVLYLILGWFFLNETFSPLQLIAFCIVLAAPFLIILTARKRTRRIKIKAAIIASIYVIIAVIANIIFVKASDSGLSFAENMIFILLGKGVINLIILAFKPSWRRRFITVLKSSHKKVLHPLIVNSFIGLVKDFTYRGSLIFAPSVALASVASDSSEPIVIFFMGLVLTLIWPKFGREKLDRKTVVVHFLATILVVTGIILMQI